MTHWRNMQTISPFVHKDNANFVLNDLGFRNAAEVKALYKPAPIPCAPIETQNWTAINKLKGAFRIIRKGKTLKTVKCSGILDT
jgi:hypothetical protein